jgi:hypothetical protein
MKIFEGKGMFSEEATHVSKQGEAKWQNKNILFAVCVPHLRIGDIGINARENLRKGTAHKQPYCRFFTPLLPQVLHYPIHTHDYESLDTR